ncbi:MAG: prolipoprotein diacylglyceryl transferase [Acidimicrobiia bacterium]|nr:prolipoprotein diacylglyceryl transferase [Acidimicrobiia bacterium]
MLASISYPPIPIFDFGPLQLSLHGLFAALGFLAGATLAVKLAGQRGFDVEAFQSVLTWALVGALLGARYLTVGAQIAGGASFVDVLNPLGGNFSIIGGMLGGIGGAFVRMRMLRQPWWAIVDSAAPGMALGTVVGRIGDLAIVEHLGATTDFFLGYAVKPGYDLAPQHTVLECTPAEAVDGICGIYHHTGLYDMIGAAVLLYVLYRLTTSWERRHYGQIFSVWVLWYGLQRFVIDFTRQVPESEGAAAAAADATLGALTWSQWAGLALAATGVFMILRLRRTQPLVSPNKDRVLAESAGRKSETPVS